MTTEVAAIVNVARNLRRYGYGLTPFGEAVLRVEDRKVIESITETFEEHRAEEYLVCRRRGHTAAPTILTVVPPMNVCQFCGTWYRFEQTLVEQNVPRVSE